MAILTYGSLVREARLNRGETQLALWHRLVEIFGDNAISLVTIKRVEGDEVKPEDRTKAQLARVLPETR